MFLFFSSVDLYMPKFSISASSCLGDTLTDMGIVDAFSDNADFSGMSENTKLKVSKVCWETRKLILLHKTCSRPHIHVWNFSSGSPPGSPQSRWERNWSFCCHHHWDHAHVSTRYHKPQQTLPGLHRGGKHQEHPLHGQDHQPYWAVMVWSHPRRCYGWRAGV